MNDLDELYQVSQAVLSVTRQMSVRDVLQVIVRSARSLVGARYAVLAGRAHGIPVAFTAPDLPELKADQEAALYRVAQEALHNALRHSGAGAVCVRLARTARRVTLEVADDGHGFAPEAPSGGVGLASMRERAAHAGGTLTIKSGTQGTLVRMTVPVPGGG